MTYEKFNEIERATDFQKMHNEWVKYAEIKATPTVFINGRRKREEISLRELAVMLAIQKEAIFTGGFTNQKIF